MGSKLQTDPRHEQELMATLWSPRLADNPHDFVLYCYPWGEANTPLAQHDGPRAWQRESLLEIAEHIAENKNRLRVGQTPVTFKKATKSGRGPGKSAMVAWLTHWMQSTRIGSTVQVTANTEAQLKDKTWGEMGKWFTLAINAHWFDVSATAVRPQDWFAELVRRQLKIGKEYYYAKAVLWNEENPDAFAGTHNPAGVLLIFDEASGIPDSIWDISEGFFTEPTEHRFWFAFGNPRRPNGQFYRCFHRDRSYWRRTTLDCRTIEGTDQQVYRALIDKYGEDHDVVRVEVKGEFPRAAGRQLIPADVVEGARDRELIDDPLAPLILGVDVARSGEDKSVLRFRRGRNARVIPPIKFAGVDNMTLAQHVADAIDTHRPDAVCIDAGNGTGVIDRLRDLGYRVHEIWFSGKTTRRDAHNKRAEMWMNLAEWLPGGCIDDDQDLFDDLIGPEYDFPQGGDGSKKILEPKEKMKKRGLASPDDGDALALTFAVRVARHDTRTVGSGRGKLREARDVDYDVLG